MKFTDYKFDVMWKDELIASVSITENRKKIEVIKYSDDIIKQPFYGGRIDIIRVYDFLRSRCFDEARSDKEEILHKMWLSEYDPWKIVEVTNGRLLEDFMWLRFPDEIMTWEGIEDAGIRSGWLFTGNQIKFLKDEYWYKINDVGDEGLAEELTSVILSCSNMRNHVKYERCEINGKPGCRSKNFLGEGESFISLRRLYQHYCG